jgi:hypothetical protein
MEIKGQIAEIIYRNDSNSYTIAEIEKDNGDSLTVVRVSTFYRRGGYPKIVWQNGSTPRLWRAI